jgi:hypothetical protein
VADYFTHFSCVLDLGTPEKAIAALDLFLRLREEDEASDDSEFSGFALSLQDGPGSSILWIHDDGQGDVEGVIRFVLRLAEELDLTGLWGFRLCPHLFPAPAGGFWRRCACDRPWRAQKYRLDQHP